jgi:hypothetical protein
LVLGLRRGGDANGEAGRTGGQENGQAIHWEFPQSPPGNAGEFRVSTRGFGNKTHEREITGVGGN